MSLRVYGCSDDLIELEGDIRDEAGYYGSDKDEPAFLFLSDGTVLAIWYGKDDRGIWAIEVRERGTLFERLDPCTDEDATPYSDVAHFKDGVEWAYFAKDGKRLP